MPGCPPDDTALPAAKDAAGVQESMDAVVRAWATTRAGINIRQGPVPPWLVERFWLAQRGLIGDSETPALSWEPLPTTEAARIKGIDSPVAGRANVLMVPDLEAGNMLAKSLSFLAGADAAGIVLGARVPVILTSRADSVVTRLASCAVASLVADKRREDARLMG